MTSHNPCVRCIGITGSGEDCCIDVYLILNSDECHLFENYSGFYRPKKEKGGIFYTSEGCPYLGEENQCTIHEKKPLYCKYYPIFITGDPYVDTNCPAHKVKEYRLTSAIEKEIVKLKKKYDIYTKEWLWDDVKKILRK
jgi:Fe-S-cluster containining protein